MYEITIYLKSGNHITLETPRYEISKNHTLNTIEYINVDNSVYKEIFLVGDVIEAYVVKEVSE